MPYGILALFKADSNRDKGDYSLLNTHILKCKCSKCLTQNLGLAQFYHVIKNNQQQILPHVILKGWAHLAVKLSRPDAVKSWKGCIEIYSLSNLTLFPNNSTTTFSIPE